MIGAKTLIIDSSDFIKGMSDSDFISNGGFSPMTDAVNLINTPGVLYAPAVAVDSDTDARLTGNVIASCPDMSLIGADNRLLVGDNDTYYRYNGTKITATPYSGGTASTTAAGFTDIITYRGEAYVSCKERIKRWQSNNTITDLGSFTTSTVPHPMLVYENNFYVADANLILMASAVNTMPTTVLTLDANQIILAMGIDAGTGLMIISTVNTLDTSGTLPTISRIGLYDGNSAKLNRPSVHVDDTVFGFHTLGGTTFVGYGKKLGYWNGAGITFLQDLNNVTNIQAELPYKHHFAHIANTLYVLDGLQILAYGEVLPGQKVFYHCFKNNVNANKPMSIGDGGNSKLIFGFATTKFYSFDTISVATTNSQIFFTNKYNFPRPVYLRSAYVEYATAIVTNDDNRSLYYQSEDLTTGLQLLRVQGTNSGAGLKNLSASSVNFIENVIGFTPNKVRSVQFRYLTNSSNSGLKRIIIFYDTAE